MNANLMKKTIEMTKAEAKAAGKIDTEEFKMLRQYMEMYPGYEIQIKAPAKRKVELRGLTYEYMRTYIQKCDKQNKADIMVEFRTLIAQDKKDKIEGSEHLEATGYLDVRDWFLKQFPEIEQRRDDHRDKVKEILSKVA